MDSLFPSFFYFSRAIMCYLVNKYATDDKPDLQKLYPKDPEMRANVDKLLYFDTGSLYKSIVDYFVCTSSTCFSVHTHSYVSCRIVHMKPVRVKYIHRSFAVVYQISDVYKSDVNSK